MIAQRMGRLVTRPATAAVGRCLTANNGTVMSKVISMNNVMTSGMARPMSCTMVTSKRQIHVSGRLMQETAVQTGEASGEETTNSMAMDESDKMNLTETRDSATIMAEYKAAKAENKPIAMGQYEGWMKGLADLREFLVCYDMIKEMKQAGVIPSADCYCQALRSGRRTLRLSEIRTLFGEVLEYTRSEDEKMTSLYFDKLKEIKEMMDMDGVEVTMWFYEDLAAWLTAAGQAGVLINLAVALEGRGVTPSTKYYNKMLFALPKSGLADRADVLFSRMVTTGVADEMSYVMRLGSLVYQKRYEDAENLFTELCAKYKPNDVAYNTIINAWLSAGQVSRAIEMLDQMKSSTSAKPNNITANTFITYFYDTGDLEYAPKIMEYFREAIQFPRDPADYSNLIKLYGRYQPNMVAELVQELRKNNISYNAEICNAFLNLVVDRRVSPEWKRNLAGLALEKPNYPVSDNGLAAKMMDFPFQTRQMVARLEAEGGKPSEVTYELVMRGLIFRKANASVMTVYQHMLDSTRLVAYPAHHNLYLTAMLNDMSQVPREKLDAFLNSMRLKRVIISKLNERLLNEMGIQFSRIRPGGPPGGVGNANSGKYYTEGFKPMNANTNTNGGGNSKLSKFMEEDY